jgi:hypothetical protein
LQAYLVSIPRLYEAVNTLDATDGVQRGLVRFRCKPRA